MQSYYYALRIIRRRKEEISAVMVYEAGKPWDEAGDAEKVSTLSNTMHVQ